MKFLILAISLITVVLAMNPPELTGKLSDASQILQATQEWFTSEQYGNFKTFFKDKTRSTNFVQAKPLIEQFKLWKKWSLENGLVPKQQYEMVVQENQQLKQKIHLLSRLLNLHHH